MTVTGGTDVVLLVDGGGQHGWVIHAPVQAQFCARDHRTKGAEPPAEGSDFCAPCLAWLRCESDFDPCDDAPTAPALARETPPHMWRPYIDMLRQGGTE